MRDFLLTGFAILISCATFAQTEVSKYLPGVTPEGATYFLPSTSLKITILIEKTTYKPGDFCKYAERYLNMKGVPYEPMTSYKISSVTMSPFGKPDKNKCYSIKFNVKSSTTNVTLSDDGLLLAINATAVKKNDNKSFVSAPKAEPLNPNKYLNEEILAAGSTAKMAELTAQAIYDIRDSKDQLNKGQADNMPKDGEQLNVMLKNLETQETALTQLFTGTMAKDTTEQTMTFDLDKSSSKQILFRFSKKMGMTDADDLGGSPYYISIEDEHTVPPVDNVAAKKQKKPENGVYINIPGKVSVKIFNDSNVFASGEFSAAQFGNTEVLSDKLFNKKYTTHVIIDPTTGGLLKLDAEQPK